MQVVTLARSVAPLVALTMLLTTVVTAAPRADAASGVDLGVHVERDGDLLQAVPAAEEHLGRPIQIVSLYRSFTSTTLSSAPGTAFMTEEEQLLADGHTLLVSWRATDPVDSATTRAVRAKQIAAGQHDSTLIAMGESLARLDGRVLLRFQWEMDKDAPDTQHIGSPAEFIAAWRHVHRTVSAIAPDVEWVWAPRANSFNKGVGQTYFPGRAYVDHIGGSAVPLAASGEEGAWRMPGEVFGGLHDFAVGKDLPMFVWVGVREKLHDPVLEGPTVDFEDDPRWKASFIDALSALAGGSWSGRLQSVVWYSTVAPSGFDFRYDTTAPSADAFRTFACAGHVAGSEACAGAPAAAGPGDVRSLPARVRFGDPGDQPLIADWNGDGLDDLVVRRFNTFLVDLDGDGAQDRSFSFGRGDEPGVLVDLDRDGRVDPTVLRDSRWVADVARDGAGGDMVVRFGSSTSRRFVGDVDGDGWDDLISVDGRVWQVDTDIDGTTDVTFTFGASGDLQLMANLTRTAGDEPTVARSGYWDVDGKHDGDVAEWRRSDLGGVGIPVAGDLDGDGDDDGGWFSDGLWTMVRTG